jgi:hypothetical protein
MAVIIAFPVGPDLLAAKSKAGKHTDAEYALWRLARFYVDMNHITGSKDVFKEGGRVAHTALEFVGQVCDTIGYHKPGQMADPQGVA